MFFDIYHWIEIDQINIIEVKKDLLIDVHDFSHKFHEQHLNRLKLNRWLNIFENEICLNIDDCLNRKTRYKKYLSSSRKIRYENYKNQ